jgi:DCC-interacting protein 13 alpha
LFYVFIDFFIYVCICLFQTALHYYAALNALQYKRKCQLLEPVLGFLHAQRSFYPMGQDIVGKPEVEDFLGNIGASVQG